MKYNKFGKTDKMVSAIGFGGMRFPDSGTSGEYDFDYCAEMIHEASKLGINYFDTAPFYNNDTSEDIYGHAFKNMPKDFFISTKSSSINAKDIRFSLEKSLRRLNVDKINFFHIWCVMSLEDYNSRIVPGGAYDELLKAKEEGLVDHICVSTHCTGEEIEIIANDNLFDGILLGYNILNYKYRQKGIEAAYKNDIAVVTMNPLGGGLIPSNPERFSYIMNKEDKNVIESSVKFNASHKEITVVLTGMDSIEHVRQNASYFSTSHDNAEKTRDRLNQFSNPELDKLCTGCRYCEPCPAGVPVSRFMQAYNRKMLSNDAALKNAIKMHWRISPESAKNCIKCGICESKCTQHLPIIERLEDICDIYELT